MGDRQPSCSHEALGRKVASRELVGSTLCGEPSLDDGEGALGLRGPGPRPERQVDAQAMVPGGIDEARLDPDERLVGEIEIVVVTSTSCSPRRSCDAPST